LHVPRKLLTPNVGDKKMKTIITTLALFWAATMPLIADEFIPAAFDEVPWEIMVDFGKQGEREAIRLKFPEGSFTNLKENGTRLVATNVPPEIMDDLYKTARSLIMSRRNTLSKRRTPKLKKDYMKVVSLGMSLGDHNARSIAIFIDSTLGHSLHSQILDFAKKMKLTIPQQKPAPYPEQRKSAAQER
jgi:hypothetical protein